MFWAGECLDNSPECLIDYVSVPEGSSATVIFNTPPIDSRNSSKTSVTFRYLLDSNNEVLQFGSSSPLVKIYPGTNKSISTFRSAAS